MVLRFFEERSLSLHLQHDPCTFLWSTDLSTFFKHSELGCQTYFLVIFFLLKEAQCLFASNQWSFRLFAYLVEITFVDAAEISVPNTSPSAQLYLAASRLVINVSEIRLAVYMSCITAQRIRDAIVYCWIPWNQLYVRRFVCIAYISCLWIIYLNL